MNSNRRETTGVLPDHVYDLTLLLQQAAQDARRYDAFALDARAADDRELADWCIELAESDRRIARRAAAMLQERLAALNCASHEAASR